MKPLFFIISCSAVLLGVYSPARAESESSLHDVFKGLFEKVATPMPISILPTPQSSDLSKWGCVGAKPDTTAEDAVEQIQDGPFAPVLVTGKNNDRAVWFLKNDGSDLPTAEEVSDQNESLNSTLNTQDGLVITMQFLDNDAKVTAKYRYFELENKTVVVIHFEGAENIPFLYNYTMCTKN